MIDQGELFVIPNPCKGVCTANNRGYCKGCLRTRQERFHWADFSPFQQQTIINLCERRRLKIIANRLAAELPEEIDEPIPQFDLFDTAEERVGLNPIIATDSESNTSPVAANNATTQSTSSYSTTSLFDDDLDEHQQNKHSEQARTIFAAAPASPKQPGQKPNRAEQKPSQTTKKDLSKSDSNSKNKGDQFDLF